jgi:hypothetical protein
VVVLEFSGQASSLTSNEDIFFFFCPVLRRREETLGRVK